jgi:DNA-binding NtrC family response regulator
MEPGAAICFLPDAASKNRGYPEEAVSEWKVLIVAENENGTITDTLLDWGIQVIHCRNLREARKILREQSVSQVFCNANLPDGSYRDLVGMVKSVQPESRVVVLIPHHSADRSFQEAIQAGAFDSIPSPVGRRDVQWEVLQAMRKSSHGKAA